MNPPKIVICGLISHMFNRRLVLQTLICLMNQSISLNFNVFVLHTGNDASVFGMLHACHWYILLFSMWVAHVWT